MTYSEVMSEKTRVFPSEASAGIFILMCCGLDEDRGVGYRYAYSFPKKVGKSYQVTIKDFGE